MDIASTGVLQLRCICLMTVALMISGCGGGLRRVPVSGTATLDGQPLNAGVIHFFPDESKGNTAKVDCLGPVRNGKFTLLTTAIRDSDSGNGAPVGWYKVYLFTDIPGVNLKIHPRFTDPNKTPVAVEVVESPASGAYEIQFASK